MTSHMKRWLTGVVGVPLIFTAVNYVPEKLFSLLVVLLILAAVTEYNRLAFGPGCGLEKAVVFVAACLIPLAFAAGAPHYVLFMIVFFALSVFLVFLVGIREASFDLSPVGKAIGGIVYIPLLFSYLIPLRQGTDGALWVFLVLSISFGGDVAAFYTGRTFGRKKLLPLVSPGKTVAGALGGYGGSVLAAFLLQRLFFSSVPAIHILIMALVGSALGQLGDLCESATKRAAGVKDSGTLLPGHGGIMDRLDSVTFVLPFVYYYRYFLFFAPPG